MGFECTRLPPVPGTERPTLGLNDRDVTRRLKVDMESEPDRRPAPVRSGTAPSRVWASSAPALRQFGVCNRIGVRRGLLSRGCLMGMGIVLPPLRQIAPPAGAGPSLVWTEVRIITAAGLHHGPRGPVRRAG